VCHQTTSSAGCELASPRPVRAVVSSFLSSDDTGSSYGEILDTEGLKFPYASANPDSTPLAGSDPGLRELPQRPTPTKDDYFLASVSTPLQSTLSPEGIDTESVSKRSGDLPDRYYDHQVNLDGLSREIDRMRGDINLAIQQPALPMPQLDDLRDRLEALASGLHAADLQGLHVKVDQLKPKSQDYTLHNEAPSSNDDVTNQLDVLTNTLNKLRLRIEEDNHTLPLIKDKLAIIQEHMEHEAAPPIPNKTEPSEDANPVQEHLVDIQKKIDNLEAILTDLRKQSEESRAAATVPIAETPQSLSVFGNRGGSKNTTEPNSVPPEVSVKALISWARLMSLFSIDYRNPRARKGRANGARSCRHSVRRQHQIFKRAE
jgi:predicted  nucleic acid-binding Zn-ribbon protein